MANYTVKFKLRADRINREGTCPIIVQAFLDGKKTVVNTGDFIPPDAWDHRKSCAKPSRNLSKEEAIEINLTLGELKQDIQRMFHEHRRRNEVVTPNKLKAFMDNPAAKFNFYEWVEQQIKQHEGARTKKTIAHYRSTFRVMREFRPNLRIADLSPELVDQFELFLQKRRLRPSTRAKYHKHLKKFSRILMRSGQCGNIYNYFKIVSNKAERVFLNNEEMGRLEKMFDNHQLHPALHTKLARFLFSCHTGIRGEGLNQLEWRNYTDGFVSYSPEKLKYISKNTKVPVSTRALQFVQNPTGYMFDVLSLQKYNKALKEIGRLAGIVKNVTSHVGRHTFATGFLMQGGNIRVLQQYLGHARIDTTMVYVHMTDEREKEERHVLENLYKSAK